MGRRHQPDNHPSLVFLSTNSKQELESALDHAREHGINTYEFHEPYQNWGLTAFACEPIPASKREAFSNFQLWRK
jgi:hypothetical protein